MKDRVVRVAAINLERGGGVPVAYGPQGASDAQLRDIATMARQFKVAEGGGGALPFGSSLKFEGGHVPDAVSLLKYCDECLARVWALMLVQLGMTTTGNRALGGEFASYAARAQRAIAKWVCRSVNLFFDDYVEYNSPGAGYAPLLHFEQEKPDALSILELSTLIESGLLTVDPELETWMRSEYGLPEAPPRPQDPELGDLSPQEVALVRSSRVPPVLPKPPGMPLSDDPGATTPEIGAAAPPFLSGEWQVPLPARQLRRQPTQIEARSRTDFRAMDVSHRTVVSDVQALMRQQIIPAQVKALGEQIDGKAMTKAAMASLKAPVLGAEDLSAHLLEAARQGANAAAAELSAQGVAAEIPGEDALSKLVSDQARAVAEMAANGISLAAQRRAQALVGGGRTVTDLRTGVESSLNEMKQQWTMDQLNGAVQMAQNAGRAATFSTASQETIRYYSSEILDSATCLRPDALVSTECGPKRAADIGYDDRLLTHAGRFLAPGRITISDVEEELVRINTQAGALTVTGDHTLLVLRDGEFAWREARQVTVADLVVSEATLERGREGGDVDLALGDSPDGEPALGQVRGFARVGCWAERVPVVAIGFDDEIAQQEVDDVRADLGLTAMHDPFGFEQLTNCLLDPGLGVRGDVAAPGAVAGPALGARDDPERLAAVVALDDDRRAPTSFRAVMADGALAGPERSAAALADHVHAGMGSLASERAVGVAAGIGRRNVELPAASRAGLGDPAAIPAGPGGRVLITALGRAVDAARTVRTEDVAPADLAGARWRKRRGPTVLRAAAVATRPPSDGLPAVDTRRIHKDIVVMRVDGIERVAYTGPVYDFSLPPDATFWADGVLVHNCDECIAVDGTEYPDLQAAEQDYAAGGYVDCAGGPRCRGTLIAVYQEPNPLDPGAPDVSVLDIGTG